MKFSTSFPLIQGIIILLAMLIVVAVSFRLSTPPEVVKVDAPDSLFSAERASRHLYHIASEKNPIGSEANENVRHYITDQLDQMNIKNHLQLTEFYDPVLQRAATLGNIIARIPGTGDGQAILFMGHYDTVEDAYGASDNGAAIAAMLELLRLLDYHPPLKNDLIFLFPDGEEVGLLGAKAFIKEHSWAEDADVVINLEARGTKGQSIMFETGYNNLELIKEFAKAVPYPATNSLSYEIYNMLPNVTDFTPFKQSGYQGLNFAYIENAFDYHTKGDNIENTDLASIQHHGSYISSLAMHLGNKSFDISAKQNAVFFNTFGYGLAYYPYNWVIPIAIITLLAFSAIIIAGFKNRFLSLKQFLYGSIGFAVFLFIIYIGINYIYNIISNYYTGSDFRLLQYNQQKLMLGFTGISIAFSLVYFRLLTEGIKLWHLATLFVIIISLMILSSQASLFNIILFIIVTTLIYFIFRKPVSVWNLTTGSFLLWTVVMLIVSFSVPGGSYLFKWPLLFSFIPVGIIFFMKQKKYYTILLNSSLLFIFAIPVLSWYPVITHLFSVSMGLYAAGITMIIIGLMMGLLIPHINIITRQKPWLVPALAFVLGLIFILSGSINLEYDERHRKKNNITYATNGLTGKTFWVTGDEKTDQYTEQFLTSSPDTKTLTDFFPIKNSFRPIGVSFPVTGDSYLYNQTTQPPLPVPTAKQVSDSIVDGKRVLTLHINSKRNAAKMTTFIKAGRSDVSIRINDLNKHKLRSPGKTNWHILRYFAMPENGIKLTIYADPKEEIKLNITDQDYGMPDFIENKNRPEYMMARGDRTIATMRFVY